MGKRQLKKYLSEIPRHALEEQLMDLYLRFPVVKEYYDFIFDPKEEKLLQGAKSKIANEYVPLRRRRPRARRSVAQKHIKHFRTLGMEPGLIADLMLYNLEIAQAYSVHRNLPEPFYKSMLNSFTEAVRFMVLHGLLDDFRPRLSAYHRFVRDNGWPYAEGFTRGMEEIARD